MTKQEYEWYHTERNDASGQTIKVGDTVVYHAWSNKIRIGKIIRMCKKKIRISDNEHPKWEFLKPSHSIIKINEYGISSNKN